MGKTFQSHPVAALFPDLNEVDFAALKEDIRKHGVKVPILLHGGQILDGRQRYRASQELGIRCRCVEWNGHDPWLEVQSRNLLRRQLSKEQVYAIRKLAAQQFPEIAGPFDAERAQARARKAQAKGRPRGEKAALIGSRDRFRESADAIGAQVGVSGSTVKRVDRLAREAPHLLPKVAAGELSVVRALRELAARTGADPGQPPRADRVSFSVDRVRRRLEQTIRQEYLRCPREHRRELLRSLQKQLQNLLRDEMDETSHGVRFTPPPLDVRDKGGLSGVRIGDRPDLDSHAMIATGFKSHP